MNHAEPTARVAAVGTCAGGGADRGRKASYLSRERSRVDITNRRLRYCAARLPVAPPQLAVSESSA